MEANDDRFEECHRGLNNVSLVATASTPLSNDSVDRKCRDPFREVVLPGLVVSNLFTGSMFAVAVAQSWFLAIGGGLVLTFIPAGAYTVLFWTMLQSSPDDAMLGRVSSLVTSITTIAIPVGSAVGGVVATLVGSWIVGLGWAAGSNCFGTYVAVHPVLRSLPPAGDVSATILGVGPTAITTANDE